MNVRSLVAACLNVQLLQLIMKEAKLTVRNRHLLFLLLFPPTIQLIILGASLDFSLHNAPLGIVDYARSRESRDLIAAITTGPTFKAVEFDPDANVLTDKIRQAKVAAGVFIPPDFQRNMNRSHKASIQVIVDGVDAFTAGVASSYLMLMSQHSRPGLNPPKMLVEPCINVLYNPEMVSSWFFLPGVLGGLITLISILVSSAALLKEKEAGTLEQLLMLPVDSWEILLAKVVPLFVLLLGDVFVAIVLSIYCFGMPFRGSPLLFILASTLYLSNSIGIGVALSTFCKSKRQAQLTSFFVVIPLILLSGSVVPLDTMPQLLQQLALIDPLRYFQVVAHGLVLKGQSLNDLWLNFVLLGVLGAAIWSFSLAKFRRQLA